MRLVCKEARNPAFGSAVLDLAKFSNHKGQNTMTKLRQVCAVAALAVTASGTALADATANVGFMSDYIFRGFYQAESSAFGGIDIEADNGFYIGAWGANVKDGLEYDLYLGYSGGGENFTWYTGFTGYYYTDEFDNSYEEFNLGFTSGFFTLDVAIGDYKNSIGQSPIVPSAYGLNPSNPALAGYLEGGLLPEDNIADNQTYTYVGATFAPEVSPVYFFIGRTNYKNIDILISGLNGNGRLTGTGSDGTWLEIGKSFELMEDLELSVAGLFSGDVPQSTSTRPSSVQLGPMSGSTTDAEYAVTVTLTKTLRLGN